MHCKTNCKFLWISANLTFALLFRSSYHKTVLLILSKNDVSNFCRYTLFLKNLIDCFLIITVMTNIVLHYLMKGESNTNKQICVHAFATNVSSISVDDTDYSCAILMAHYFHHLTLVNFQIFICIAIVYIRYTNDNTHNYWKDYWVCGDADKRGILSSFLVSMYLFANWLCIRYDTYPIASYQLPFNLLLHNISFMIDPINFLCSFISPGKEKISWYLLLLSPKLIAGPEIIDSQWKPTLYVINFGSIVLRMSVELSQTSMENKIIPLTITLATCCWTYHIGKLYFDTYVAPALD